ncbi:MAG: type II secretion system secretin GspD [bacterium]
MNYKKNFILFALILPIILISPKLYCDIKPEIIKQEREKNKLIAIDFEDAEIRTVIKAFSEITGKNFIVDEQVKGKVTVLSPQKIPPEEAYNVFLSLLEVKGYTVVSVGSINKIISISEAAKSSVDIKKGIYLGSKEDTIVTQLIPLNFAEANQVRALLAPLISRGGNILAYDPTNTIIITDSKANISRLSKILKEIDIKGAKKNIKVIPLNYASANEFAKELNLITAAGTLGEVQKAKKHNTFTNHNSSKIIPDNRTNSLIIVATTDIMEAIIDLVNELDKETPRGKEDINVYYLKNAKADDLAKVLSGLVSNVQGQQGQATSPNNLLKDQAIFEGKSIIMADKSTNSLIITASPQDYTVLKKIIERLDILRPQVLVEALIAEVSLDKVLDIGTEWRFLDKPQEGSIRPSGGTNFGKIDSAKQGLFNGLMMGLTKGNISIGGTSYPNIGAVIQAYQNDQKVNILSTPHILTSDNEEAEIVVGQVVPFQTSQRIVDNIPYNTYDYKDVGITLRITPHINDEGYVRLDIFQEIRKLIEGPAGDYAPTTTKRQAKTTVIVPDGQTVVIGGLIKDDKVTIEKKVPCLGNIPIFGYLFKTTTDTVEKTNLQIFITPTIINSFSKLDSVTEKYRNNEQ